MIGTRTTKQIEANKLDLEMYRLVTKMERFATLYNDPIIDRGAATVFGLRTTVRQHMHKDDREKTQ